MYVIKRTDQGGGYLANPSTNPTGGSYTRKLEYARTFGTRDAAQAQCCAVL